MKIPTYEQFRSQQNSHLIKLLMEASKPRLSLLPPTVEAEILECFECLNRSDIQAGSAMLHKAHFDSWWRICHEKDSSWAKEPRFSNAMETLSLAHNIAMAAGGYWARDAYEALVKAAYTLGILDQAQKVKTGRPSGHEATKMAVEAGVDPRTLRRVLDGKPVTSTAESRIRPVLEANGWLPAKAKGRELPRP